MRSVVLVVVLAACAPQQPQPSYYTQQPQQPGYAPQPVYGQPQQAYEPQQQPQARAATCPQVIGCYLQCTATECIYGCEAGIDPNVVAAARAITQCSLGHQCTNNACQQTQCGRELAACTGQQPQAPIASTAPQPQPAPATPVASGAHYRVLMGKLWLTSGYRRSPNRELAWYVLFDSGRMTSEIPFTGLYGVDESQARGTFVDNGNVISYNDSASTFRRGSDGMWTNGEGEFWMVDALDNAVLDGTFRSAGGTPIAFSRDGRFTTAQLWFLDSNIQTGTKEVPAGSGTYRILRNTLMLTYSTGQVVWIAITSFETNQFPTPSTIYLVKDQYSR